MPARVLQGLARPGRVERGGPEGPWQTVPLGEQLLPHCHPLSGTGAGVVLPVGRGSDSVSKRHVCVCLQYSCVFMCMRVRLRVSTEATYSCQTSADKHGHP